MKNLITFILFLIYAVSIFFVKNYAILGVIFVLNFVLVLILKINVKKIISNISKLLPFILFTVFVNILFADFNFAILIGVRLILVCNLSYIYSKTISYTEFGELIEKIMYPFKIFGINPQEIGLVMEIAISFIPIFKNEFSQMKNMLKVKGIKPTIFNILKNLSLIFKPFFVSVLRRTNDIEMSLKGKGYQE